MKRTGFKRREGPTSERETKPRARPAPKPGKCKHCKQRVEIVGKVIHDECIPAFVDRMKAKRAAAKAKVERQSIRQRKEAIKTIPDLTKEAQREFNAFIRLRDRRQPCICCGRPLPSGSGGTGGLFDCGHFRSVGSASHLRFDERNAHGQRKQCNRYGAGRAVDYRIGLAARIGLEAVEALEADNTPHKWTKEELIGIRDTYRAKVRAMEKEQA